VTFNSNGGSSVNTQTVTEGGKVTEPQGVTKNRHIIESWYRDTGFTVVWNFSTDTITADLVLYAKWIPNPVLIAADFGAEPIDRIFDVRTTAEWDEAIDIIRDNGGNYLMNVNDNISISPSNYLSYTFSTRWDTKVAVWSDKEITLLSPGSIFYFGSSETEGIKVSQTVTLRDITLRGRADNTAPMIQIQLGGTLIMKGNATITGNINNEALNCGIYVSGTFIMESGVISNNTTRAVFLQAGAVGLWSGYSSVFGGVPAIFIKTGGIIYGYTEGDPLSNTIINSNTGDIITTRGAALRLNSPPANREKTIGPDQQLEYDGSTWVKWVDDDGVVTNQ
jgi:uncharacterized repeat protein (TIGR02543 family)